MNNMKMMMPLLFAPLQGYTEDAYRRIHNEVCGGIDEYYTPFVRWEHGGVRSKDMRDIRRDFNQGVNVCPQIIAGGADEFRHLVDVVLKEGYDKVDVNMGCPFPLQTRHGHGAGILPHPDKVEEVCKTMEQYPEVLFSVKMRLGLDDREEWKRVVPILNDVRLRHITVHPRIASQQYKGEVDMVSFSELLGASRHPVIYNGDVCTAEDIGKIATAFPNISGIMIGRGLLARPTLATEVATGSVLTSREVIARMCRMHDLLLHHYEGVIPTEDAILSKLRTFWDFAEPTIGRKNWKKLKKAGNMRNYLKAVSELQ